MIFMVFYCRNGANKSYISAKLYVNHELIYLVFRNIEFANYIWEYDLCIRKIQVVYNKIYYFATCMWYL